MDDSIVLFFWGKGCLAEGLEVPVAAQPAKRAARSAAVAMDFCIVLRNLLQALLHRIGLAQVGALIPGVSRSGSTLTGAMFLNFRREDAAQFSFLLGPPAIALAGLKELLVLWRAHIPLDAW
jgi:undecaprenyl pyrophosphate phosphatase UppP